SRPLRPTALASWTNSVSAAGPTSPVTPWRWVSLTRSHPLPDSHRRRLLCRGFPDKSARLRDYPDKRRSLSLVSSLISSNYPDTSYCPRLGRITTFPE